MAQRHLSVTRHVPASAQAVYAAVSDLDKVAERSPENIAAWRLWRGEPRPGGWFIGWNRAGRHLWPTTCRVAVADPPLEFAFDVSLLGLPVARWGYTITPEPDGCTVTEHWDDRRGDGPAGALMRWAGSTFAGSDVDERVRRNRRGMTVSLDRLAAALAGASSETASETASGAPPA